MSKTYCTITTYRDTDPLGKGEWFGYLAADGHIFRNFGGYQTEEQALAAGRAMAGETYGQTADRTADNA